MGKNPALFNIELRFLLSVISVKHQHLGYFVLIELRTGGFLIVCWCVWLLIQLSVHSPLKKKNVYFTYTRLTHMFS